MGFTKKVQFLGVEWEVGEAGVGSHENNCLKRGALDSLQI